MGSWQDDWISHCEAEFHLRDREFAQKQQQIVSDFVKAGAASSSRMVMALFQALDEEVALRARLTSEEFDGWLASLATVAAGDLNGAEDRADTLLRASYDHLYEQTSISGYDKRFDLEAFRADSQRSLSSCLQRLRLELRKLGGTAMNTKTGKSGPTYVTIHGHGNVVQAGIQGSTVGLNYDSSTKHSLTVALEDLARAIKQSDVDPAAKAELLEVTAECKAEVEKPNPNRVKFMGLLSGLATAVQTIGSLEGAWHVFKGAAAAAGIDIP